jgi:hypothetical protein
VPPSGDQPEPRESLAVAVARELGYRYGPFHRLESPTQTADDASKQEASGEIWGRTPFGSSWPQVQAYAGPLPDGASGVEFMTDVRPDQVGESLRWSGDGRRAEVQTEGAYAKIRCIVTLNTQVEDEP